MSMRATNIWRFGFIASFIAIATWAAAIGFWPVVPVLCLGIALYAFLLGVSKVT